MAESMEDTSKQQPGNILVAPVEVHGDFFSDETLKEEDDALSKSLENSNPDVTEALSSSVVLEKNSSFSKLNAQAPEFVPRVQSPGPVQMNAQVPRPALVDFTQLPPSLQLVEQQHETEPTVASTSSPKPLSDEMRQKIVKQVEFYFSDANLPTDKYLMKFVKKDPDGFVPISVVASFRKIKTLVNNHAFVGAALRTSSQLVVSEDGKKVRRLHPLPDIDIEEMQLRTIVAENLPSDCSIQNLEKLFGGVGNVKTVRVCHPHGFHNSGQGSTRPSKNDMLVSNRLHALVEYETVEQAEKAVMELNDEGNWRSGLQVQLLFKRMGKYGHQTKGRKSDNADVHGEEEDGSNVADAGNDKQPKASAHHSEQHDDFDGDGHHSNERNGGKRGRGRGRGKPRGRGQYHSNGRGHPVGTAISSNSTSSEVAKQPPGPRMPDGTRGFTMGRASNGNPGLFGVEIGCANLFIEGDSQVIVQAVKKGTLVLGTSTLPSRRFSIGCL